MTRSLNDNLKRQYDEEDEDGDAAKREVLGRVCLQRFFDRIEREAKSAEKYVNEYNATLEESK